ncbi:MAG: hypothetical protein HUJ93_02890, partial [Bacteroidales bacterium]|nr:hypothetical protein [Bacteroidales bacterium]
IIAKHRNGEVGDVEMRFIKSEVRFEDRSNESPVSFDQGAYSRNDGGYDPQDVYYQSHESKMNSMSSIASIDNEFAGEF